MIEQTRQSDVYTPVGFLRFVSMRIPRLPATCYFGSARSGALFSTNVEPKLRTENGSDFSAKSRVKPKQEIFPIVNTSRITILPWKFNFIFHTNLNFHPVICISAFQLKVTVGISRNHFRFRMIRGKPCKQALEKSKVMDCELSAHGNLVVLKKKITCLILKT